MDYGEWFNPCLQYRLGVIRVLRRRLYIKDLRAMIYRYLPFADKCRCVKMHCLRPTVHYMPLPDRATWLSQSQTTQRLIFTAAMLYLGFTGIVFFPDWLIPNTRRCEYLEYSYFEERQ